MARRGQIEEALRRLAPGIPAHEFEIVADRAMDSRGLKTAYPAEAAWLALVAYVRHVMTDYDALLRDGYDADSARFFVLDEMNEVLEGWDAKRRLSGEETEA